MTQRNTSTEARVYGYCRVSTKHQSVKRQEAEIKAVYPDAMIYSEQWTGTEMDRPEWLKLRKKLRPGDTVVFWELSRLARNAEQGFQTYEELYSNNVNMVFLKDSSANSDVYRKAMNQRRIEANISTGSNATDTLINAVLDALHRFTMDIVREQIQHSFDSAQAERDHLVERVKSGMNKPDENGHTSGDKIAASRQGRTFTTKKELESRQAIKKYSKDFDGHNTDTECMRLIGISRGSFYKYKKALWNELHSAQNDEE